MFTGLIRSIGTLKESRPIPGGRLLRIRHGLEGPLEPGASVAVNGVCLTAVADEQGVFEAECYYESLKKTALGSLRPGARLNLEPALRLDAPLDGHLVQGHVSAVVRVLRSLPRGRGRQLVLSLPREGREGLVPEGSVALDGVSLTIARLDSRSLEVQLIGETLNRTTLAERRGGDLVNLETDFLLRSHHQKEQKASPEGGLTKGLLAQWGYV